MTVSVKSFNTTLPIICGYHLIIHLLKLFIILWLELIFPDLETLWADCLCALVQDEALLLAFLIILQILHIQIVILLICIDIVLLCQDNCMQFFTKDWQFDTISNQVGAF